MEHSACFIGHRKINNTPELRTKLNQILIELVKNGTVNFIFGDHSEFDDLCYYAVTELQEMYPHIKRIKFRKDYENTNDYTMQLLMTGYEENICPKGVGSAGYASYVERNQAMIRESDVCVFYYSKNYTPQLHHIIKKSNYGIMLPVRNNIPKSGTKIAYDYAVKCKKKIINLY